MGLYDVQLDEPRPQFGQERQKKNRLILLFYMSRVYSKTGATSPASLFHPFTERIQSRREDGMCFLLPLQPLPRPCIHACAHPHAILGTAAACFTSDAKLTSSQLCHHCSQARYAAGADGLEEETFRSTSHKLRTISHKSVKEFGRCGARAR